MSTSSRGFTLIEVLLVVTIMAILSVGAFSGMVSLQRSARVNETHSRLVTFLDLARNYALNGKQVSSSSCPSGSTECVPSAFGVAILSSGDKCPAKSDRILLYYTMSDQFSMMNEKHILDPYCIPAKVLVEFPESSSGTPIQKFQYSTPFGLFRAQYVDEKNTTASALTILICDEPKSNFSCAASSLSKSLTLYTNVGVPE